TTASVTFGKATVAARSMNDGSVLVDSVNRIRDDVNKEVAKSEPDLQQLTANLQKTLSTSAGLITGKTALFTPTTPSPPSTTSTNRRVVATCTASTLSADEAEVQDKARPVEAVVNDLEVASKIETCHQSSTQALAEAALRVQPSDSIVLV